MIAVLRRRLRDIHKAWWLLPVLSVAVAFAWRGKGGIERLENVSYDQRLRAFTPAATQSDHVVLVELDGRTLRSIQRNPRYHARFGNHPFARTLWVWVGDHLLAQGAKAVVMDVLFEEESSDRESDDRLAGWLNQTHPPVYFAFTASSFGAHLPTATPGNRHPTSKYIPLEKDVLNGEDAPAGASANGDEGTGIAGPEDSNERPGDPAAEDAHNLLAAQTLPFPVRAAGVSPLTLRDVLTGESSNPDDALYPVPPIPEVLRSGAGFGLTLHEEDPDATMRRTHFAFTDGAHTYVTLATAVAADLLGVDEVSLLPGRLSLGSRSLRIDRDGTAELDYGGTLRARYRSVALFDVLQDAVHRQNHEPLELPPDLFRDKVVFITGTSAGTYDLKTTPFDSRAPGVVKVVSELDSLLYGRFITHAPPSAAWALAFAFCFLCALAIWGGKSAWVELLTPVAAVGGLFALTGALLVRGHLHVDFARPALAILLTCVGAIVAHRLSVSKERERVKAIFGHFVAKPVVEQLVSQPTLPRLDGEEREITAFFSDIKGFSSFSEKLKDDPRKLVRMLNTYLTRVSGVLQKHGGCLDKYIGDAVVCIFGAPLSTEDHAVRACRAALEVQSEIAALRAEFHAQGLPDVYTRIGMNSAVMFVGNFGSEQLFNYTAMGDGMNLASRLEGANKPYGSSIMIGPRTYELAREHIEARELDAVRVAGKQEPVRVYELLALKGELSEHKQRAVERYAVALASFRQGRFEDAAKILEDALAIDPGDPPSEALLARCRAYAVEPPPGFDGITQLEK